MMVFRTFFRCFFFWLDVPLGRAGGAAGAGASVTGAFCCVISAMFGFLLSFLWTLHVIHCITRFAGRNNKQMTIS